MADTSVSDLHIPGFGGHLIRPGDPDYDDARRVFNAMIDRSPAMLARCVNVGDVVAALAFGRDHGLTISVYGGGHSVTGSAVVDGGLCIDLRGIRDIVVDPVSKTARVSAGCTWGEVDAATQAHGLAVTGGRVSSTGVGGLALGSGSGWLERKFGYTCDNLLRAEVVTADGRSVIASATENPGLFWGLRGGGGNFGIVTSFELQLHDVGPTVLAGMLLYPAAMGGDLIRFYREFMPTASDDLACGIAFITAPPAPFVPEPVRGHPLAAVILAHFGEADAAEEALRPLRAFGPPAVDLIDRLPYVALQQMVNEGNPPGVQNYWTADFYSELPDEAIDTLVDRASKPVSPLAQVLVVAGGGAISRVDDAATAFGDRHAAWNIHYLSMWADPADTELNIEHTRAMSQSMKPWTTGHVYLNYIGNEGADRVRSSFGAAKYERLQAIKREWDPTNLFHHNQNIPPD